MASNEDRTTPKPPPALLLTVPQTAAMIGCSPKAVWHRIARHQLPGIVRIGRSVYVRRADLLRFLAEEREPSPRDR
jgi:predicted DNA-binding transcriptional regulator AlpA